MSLMCSSSSVIPAFQINQWTLQDLKHRNCFSSEPKFTLVHGKTRGGLCSSGNSICPCPIFKRKPTNTLRFTATKCVNSNDQLFGEDSTLTYDMVDQQQEDIEDTGTPWEGAVVYERSPSIAHVEYCTTLERLGMGNLSSEISKNRASVMGLRVTKAVKDFPLGTPVLISVDVTRRKQKIRLDGIVRTVLTLYCNRCGEPTAESVFSNFSLVLTEEPIEEPDVINLGVIYGEDKSRTSGSSGENEDDDSSIDLDDWLYFPPDRRTIDISKHIRDMVHIEITINALCDGQCKGLCLKCGTNLNGGNCSCGDQKTAEKSYGPLAGLKEQMKKR